MPENPDAQERLPSWARRVGCINPGHDRVCDSCQMKWQSGRGGRGMLIRGWPDLLSVAGATTRDEVGDWLHEMYELDLYLEWGTAKKLGVGIAARINEYGCTLDFPFLLTDLWTALSDLHDEAEAASATDGGGGDDQE